MPAKETGFTVLEVIATVSVSSILLAIALPVLGRFIEYQRTSAAIGSLVAHMGLARMAAISHRQPTILCPSTSGASCDAGSDWSGGWMLFIDNNRNNRPDSDDEVLRVDLDPTSRTLRLSGTSGRRYLRYLPDGRSAGSNLTISLCNRKGEKLGAVIVNNAGRPRSERARTGSVCPG